MRGPTPPVRFLLAVICGWAGFRAAMLALPWRGDPSVSEVLVPRAGEAAAVETPSRARAIVAKETLFGSPRAAAKGMGPPLDRFGAGASGRLASLSPPAPLPVPRPSISLGRNAVVGGSPGRRDVRFPATTPPAASAPPPSLAAPTGQRRSRWSVSAWLFARRGSDAAGLAPGGTLGGSQAGARAAYRLTGGPGEGLALTLRLYAPLRGKGAAEAAPGLDWKPLRALPLHLLVERRARLGRDGRSAFGLTAYGGVDEAVIGALRLSAYGQAGIVGARRRDLFAEGAARFTLPLGRVRIGAGAWAAAQPGVSRLDAGPHAELNLRAGAVAVTVAADWRIRVAGTARPGSGPAITLSTGF